MTSYSVYIWAEIGPVIALFGILYAILLVYMFYVYVDWQSSKGHLQAHKSEQSIVKFVLRNIFEERDGTLYIHNRIVNSLIIKTLVIYVLNIAVLAFAVGWNIFLLERTYACDPGLDCFISENGEQIQNCSALYNPANNNHSEVMGNISNNTNDGNTTDSSNPSIICFKFVTNYVTAASTIGGLFTFGGGVMSLLAFGNIWMYDRVLPKFGKIKARLFMLFLQAVSFLVSLTLFYVTILEPELANAVLKDRRSYIQFTSLVVTVFFTLMVPWYLLQQQSNEQVRNQQHNEDGETENLVDPTNPIRVYH